MIGFVTLLMLWPAAPNHLANNCIFLLPPFQPEVQSDRESERYALHRVIAESAAMKPLMQEVRELTRNDQVSVLLQGETGTGKQFMGRLIHFNSSRAHKTYIEIDCPAIPHDLFESELFGHEKGAFTGPGKPVSHTER